MAPSPSATHGTYGAAWAEALQAWKQGRFEQVALLLEPWLTGLQAAPEALQLAGLARLNLNQPDQALRWQLQLVQVAASDVAAWINLASTQAALGQTTQALDSLAQALKLDPTHPAAHFNRGNVHMQGGDPTRALASYRRAGELAPDRPDPFCNHALALNALARHDEAREILQSVVARHPNLAAAWNLLGITWHHLHNDHQALACYQRALQLAPALADAWGNAAQVLARLDRQSQAIAHAERAVQLDPQHAVAIRTLGVVLARAKRRAQARSWLDKAHRLDPDDPIALSNLLAVDLGQCAWDAVERDLAALRSIGPSRGLDGVEIWHLLALDVPADELRRITEQTCARRFSKLPGTEAQESGRWRIHVGRPRPPRLRIGYFSSDFHQHATSVLMAGMFEQHDRSRFETVAFCWGRYPPGADDPMRQRVRAAFDRFELVSELDDTDLVRRARDLDLHIAVDLKGHTAGSRLGIFARRVAPVQMHHIGQPGTIGMPGSIDYLVADPVVVPASARPWYSEKIIALPDSYQANDRSRTIAPEAPSRESQGLPVHGWVFCCFNNHYKITREVFALWMTLLRERPASVLWLLVDDEDARRHLRTAATAHGVAWERLVFAARAPLPQHLARHACADLFLDTWPFNAHTTASDALWAGLPLLTCAGSTFASRVGASLLHACGLPQLVAHDTQAYVQLALQLSGEPQRVQQLRHQLTATRLSVPLFDAARFTRHIETAYDLAWERHCQGLPPEHFSVPPRP